MKLIAIVVAMLATIVPFINAQFAIVQNNCAFPAYVQSVPYDGSAPGPLTTLAPGTSFREDYRASGSTVKMGTASALARPLFFGYSRTSSPNLVYYELNNRFGNPFANYRVTLAASPSCGSFNCAAGAQNCYSTATTSRVISCPRPVSVTATLCAAA